MNQAITLLELAERCEKATGPDRKLDHDIYMAADVENGSFETGYTASLDAAMTLALEGYSILMTWNGRDSICHVHAQPIGVCQDWTDPGRGQMPALALCAAALRARAAMETPA